MSQEDSQQHTDAEQPAALSAADPSAPEAGSAVPPSAVPGSRSDQASKAPPSKPLDQVETGLKPAAALSASPAAALDAGRAWQPSMTFLVVVSLVNFVADVASKQWTKHYFDNLKTLAERRIVVIDGFMNLIYARNRGGAWGFLQGSADALRRPFFLVVSVAAIVFIVSLYRKLNRDQWVLRWGLPLVLGGALGNLADRIYYGFVIDFIDVYITRGGQESHWPTFNVADISICVGVVLMAIDMFTSQEPKNDKAKSESSEDAAGTAASLGAPPLTRTAEPAADGFSSAPTEQAAVSTGAVSTGAASTGAASTGAASIGAALTTSAASEDAAEAKGEGPSLTLN